MSSYTFESFQDVIPDIFKFCHMVKTPFFNYISIDFLPIDTLNTRGGMAPTIDLYQNSPTEIKFVLGRKVNRDFEHEDLLKWDDLMQWEILPA